jgi:hypothetical protein
VGKLGRPERVVRPVVHGDGRLILVALVDVAEAVLALGLARLALIPRCFALHVHISQPIPHILQVGVGGGRGLVLAGIFCCSSSRGERSACPLL